MRLNLGCGKTILDGWFNIDAAVSPKASRPPELLCDVKKIPLPDACADEIMAIHLFEHLYRWECDPTIDEWRRLLKPQGKLILEMPDIFKCCRNILEGREGKKPDQLGMWGIYGDPMLNEPLMVHHWGWTFKTIKPFLQQHGFENILEHDTQFHLTGRGVRDFRVTAQKTK
jgi:ubiquinone/menaquinone biosynthesis C-methylase UbiE